LQPLPWRCDRAVDELNRFAPSDRRGEGGERGPHPPRLEELTQRARSDRITLFTAQQSRPRWPILWPRTWSPAVRVMSGKEAGKSDYALDITDQYTVCRLAKAKC